MAVDIFLKLDQIKGESKDATHKDEIQVLSFSDGVTQPTGRTGGGSATAKAVAQDIVFTKHLDIATPLLFAKSTNGQPIATATFTFRKAGGDVQVDYLTLTLTAVIISAYSHGGDLHANDEFVEHVSLNYQTIKYSYQPQDKTGAKAGGSIDAGWDFTQNQKL